MIIGMTSGKNILLSSILLFQATAIAEGQIPGGMTETTNTRMGGNNYVVGTVFWPSGAPVNTRISIRLTTPEFGDFQVTTDETGKFVFSGVGSGVYTLIIDSEPDFEPVREEVAIVRNRSAVPETYNLTIRLRDKVQSRTKAERPGVINVDDAAVPKAVLKYYEKATELASSGDYRGAIKQLEFAVKASPQYLNAWNEIGVLYLRLNELDKADEALQVALKIKPDAYEPLINRGIALFRLKRFEDSEPFLRDALKANSASAAAYYYLGRALHKMGRNAEAEAEFVALVKMSPGEFKEVHRLLAVIYLDRGDGQRVIEELEKYLQLVPAAPDSDDLKKVIEQIKSTSKKPAN